MSDSVDSKGKQLISCETYIQLFNHLYLNWDKHVYSSDLERDTDCESFSTIYSLCKTRVMLRYCTNLGNDVIHHVDVYTRNCIHPFTSSIRFNNNTFLPHQLNNRPESNLLK